MDLLTECCDNFREMVYNYCSLFMQQMLPQVDGPTYPIQHRFTQSMNFIIQCISKFFTVAKFITQLLSNFGHSLSEKNGLQCVDIVPMCPKFCAIFSLKFCISD